MARVLAVEWGRPWTAIEQMLMVYGDDVEVVKARYAKDGVRPRAKASRPNPPARQLAAEDGAPRRGIIIKYPGVIFPSRAALSRRLAPQLGRSAKAIDQLLEDRALQSRPFCTS